MLASALVPGDPWDVLGDRSVFCSVEVTGWAAAWGLVTAKTES